MLTPVLVIIYGLLFCIGFAAGAAVFARVLQQREQRLTAKVKAVESARLYLRRHGIELPAWVASVVDRERQEQAAQRQRRSWWRRLGRSGGRRG